MLLNYLRRGIRAILMIILLLLQLGTKSRPVNAQGLVRTAVVRGSVVDHYGHPLAGVKVSVESGVGSVVSDRKGGFVIPANTTDKLIFDQPGFYLKRCAVPDNDSLVVRLEERYLQQPENIQLLYREVPKDQFLGSVSTIYTPQLTTTPASQYSFALTGRLAGLYTRQSMGWPAPGSFRDNTELQLSLRGQTPVTIVDGVQRDIYSLAPENIESISVLKDALSSILLGQLSSNGIVLVTTKRPQAGTPRISFTAQTGVQTPLKLPESLSAYQYEWLYNEALQNDGLDPAYSAEEISGYRNHSDFIGYPDVNWHDAILRSSAPQNRYDLSISGGNEVARYIVSAGYMNRQGLLEEAASTPYKTNTNIHRYTMGTHVDVQANKDLLVALDIFGRIEDYNEPGAGTEVIMNALFNTPNNAYPIFNPDGSLGGNSIYTENLYGQSTSSGYIAGNQRDVMANVDLKYDFGNWVPGLWLKVKGNISISSFGKTSRVLEQPVFKMAKDPQTGDTVYQRFGNSVPQGNSFSLGNHARYWYGQFSLGYTRQFGDNYMDVMVFGDQRQVALNYDLPGKYTNLATEITYNRGNKYFAEAAINYSGYDRYRPGIRFGLFYAGGLGWDMAQANFLKDNISWINLLKWRITYGLTGNANVGYFIYKTYYTGATGYYFGANPAVATTGERESSLPNPDATWEKARKLNVGLDIGVFNDHLKLTAEYYRYRYFDLMQVRGKNTSIIGSTYPNENIGINRYVGAELSLTYQDHFGNLNWFVTANASSSQGVTLYSDEEGRKYSWNKSTGRPINQLFGYMAEGLYQNAADADASPHIVGYEPVPGDIKYKDLNNDGLIDHFDVAPIGNGKPLIYYGITAGISFKGLDGSILLQGVQNNDLMLTGNAVWVFNDFTESGAWINALGRWTPEAPDAATLPRLTAGRNPNNTVASSFWVRSGNYFRIKNVEVGYNLPYRWTSWLRLGSIRFFANGMNLFTKAAYERADPEVSHETADRGIYPIQKITNVGINIKF